MTNPGRRSEPIFHQIADSFPELVHTARPDGYLDFFNQTRLDFTSLPLKKLLGWVWPRRISCVDFN
jgi:hypothetical protein